MIRLSAIVLLAGFAPALGGCVASMAVSAVGMAAQSATPRPRSNETLQPNAATACTAAASKYGTVHVIDVEQHAINKIIVWGTVDDGKTKRSFQCNYGTKINGLKLSAIKAAG